MKKIIDNLTLENNHYSTIKSLISKSTELLFASPFLMKDFKEFLSDLNLKKINLIILLTTLKPKDRDQIIKVNSLVSLFDFINDKYKHIKVKIFINNSLHGKIYIFKNNSEYISGIITSANLTDNGLSINYEWGIELDNENIIKKLENDIFNNLYNIEITEDDLLRFLIEIDNYLQNKPTVVSDKIDLDLNLLMPDSNKFQFSDEKNFLLKPIGVTGDTIEDGQLFKNLIERLDFSKRRPTGVNTGDIIIAYGVGNGKVLSVYEVKTTPKLATKKEIEEESWKERWPWSIEGINLSQIYGSKWWTYNLHLTELMNEYIKLNQNNTITYIGGKTLGALNFGLDKIKLYMFF